MEKIRLIYFKGLIYLLFLVLTVTISDKIHAEYIDHRNRKVDSLEHILKNRPPLNADSLVRIYQDLMWGYSEIDSEKSMMYARRSADICQQEDFVYALCCSYRMIGIQYYDQCIYDSALHYLNLALGTSQHMLNDRRYNQAQVDDEQSLIYGTIANIYNMQGMNTLAIDYYDRASNIFEKYKWNESLATVYLNISELYFAMDNYRMAEEYIYKLDSLAHITADSLFLAKSHLQKGKLYRLYHNDLDKAKLYADSAANYLMTKEDEGTWKIICLHLLEAINLDNNDLIQAEKDINKQLALAEEMKSPYDISSALTQQAQLYTQREEWTKVIKAAQQAISYNDTEPENLFNIYKLLGKASVYLHRTDDAIKYYDKAFDLKTSWSNQIHQSALAEQKVYYETAQKEIRINSLEKERNLMQWIAISGGTLAFFILLLLFYRNRLHRHQKRLIATKVAIESETTERQRIAQDLHDGLGGILTLAKLQLENGDTKKASEFIDKSMTEMRQVAHHIMPESLINHGLVTSLEDFALAIPNASFQFYGTETRIDIAIEVIIYRSAYELTNNALRHAAATQITIQLFQQPNRIALSVSDNGSGFNPNSNKHGIGLQNIRNRIAIYGGKIHIESHPQKGTEILIEVPIIKHKTHDRYISYR